MKRSDKTDPVPANEVCELIDDVDMLRALQDIGAPKRLAPVRGRLMFWFRVEDVLAARTLLSLTRNERQMSYAS